MGIKIRRTKKGFAYYAEYKLGLHGVIYEKIPAPNAREAKKLYSRRLEELREQARRSIPPPAGDPPDSITALSINVVAARKALKMSQEELAVMAGIDRSYISQIEKAKRNVTLDIVDALAGALQTTTADLLSLPPLDPGTGDGSQS